MKKVLLVLLVVLVGGVANISMAQVDSSGFWNIDAQAEGLSYCSPYGSREPRNKFEIGISPSGVSAVVINVIPDSTNGSFAVEYRQWGDDKLISTTRFSNLSNASDPSALLEHSDVDIVVLCGMMRSKTLTLKSAYKVPISASGGGFGRIQRGAEMRKFYTYNPRRSQGTDFSRIDGDGVPIGESDLAHSFSGSEREAEENTQNYPLFPSDSRGAFGGEAPYNNFGGHSSEQNTYASIFNYKIIAQGDSGTDSDRMGNEYEYRDYSVILIYGLRYGLNSGAGLRELAQRERDFESGGQASEVGSASAGSGNAIQQAEWQFAPCPEDVSGDRVINIVDLVTIARRFGERVSGVPVDVNGDGIINIIDLVTVARKFGQRCPDAGAYISPTEERVVFVPVPITKQPQNTGFASVLKSIFWVIGN